MKIVRATFHLNDADLAALTGAEPKLSRIPPAHWRNVYEFLVPALHNEAVAIAAGCEILGPNIWRGPRRYLTREMAEQRGLNVVANYNREQGFRALAFLRAEKFEGEAP